MKDFHFSKKFLNKDGYLGIAAIMTSLSFSPPDKMWHTFDLKISDCKNEINLDLTLEDDGHNNYENSLHKVDTLINELEYLRAKMIEGKVEYDRRKAIFEEKKSERLAGREERAAARESALIQDTLNEDNHSNS